MQVLISGWMLFCVAAAILTLTALVMQRFGSFSMTRDVLVRDFAILDLELASTEMEIDNTLKGITQLDPAVAGKVVRSLKGHIYTGFVFMPAAYGAIFIACMKVAWKMPESGQIYFSLLAWLQIVAWICGMLENGYLLTKINHVDAPAASKFISFRMCQYLEGVKLLLSLLAVVCVLSALMYFWISGLYMGESLLYLLVIAIEAAVLACLMIVLRKDGKKWKATVRQ